MFLHSTINNLLSYASVQAPSPFYKTTLPYSQGSPRFSTMNTPQSQPPHFQGILLELNNGSPLALATSLVSIALVSISTAAVTLVIFAIIKRSALEGAGGNLCHEHFPIRERMLLGLFVSHVWTECVQRFCRFN